MLANLHSELVSELDTGATFEFQRSSMSAEPERHNTNDSHSLKYLHQSNEVNMIESVGALQMELDNSTTECFSLNEFAQDLQRKVSEFESIMIAKEADLELKESQNAMIMQAVGADTIQTAIKTALQLKIENSSYKIVLENLRVSNGDDAILAIQRMRTTEQEILPLRSVIADMSSKQKAANNQKQKAMRLVVMQLRAKVAVQVFRKWTEAVAELRMHKAAAVAKAAKKTKHTVRRNGILQRASRKWANRVVSATWSRWVEFAHQRSRGKLVCARVLQRIRHSKVAISYNAWSRAVSAWKRQKGKQYRVIMRLKLKRISLSFQTWAKATTEHLLERAAAAARHASVIEENSCQLEKERARRDGILLRASRKWTNRGISAAWSRWAMFAEQRIRRKQVCARVLKRIRNMKAAMVFDAWSKTASTWKRHKVGIYRVLIRLKLKGISLSFQRWAKATVKKREERAAACAKQAVVCRVTKDQELIQFQCMACSFANWRLFVSRVTEAKYVAQLCSLKSEYESKMEINDAKNAKIEIFQFKQASRSLLAHVFFMWMSSVSKAAQSSEISILKVDYDKILKVNAQMSEKLQEVEFHFAESKFAHERLKIDNITQKSENHIMQLQFQEIQKQLFESQAQHSAHGEQERLSAIEHKSESRKNRFLELDGQLKPTKQDTSNQTRHHDLKEPGSLQVKNVRESFEEVHELRTKLEAALSNNRDLLMENVEIMSQIQQFRKSSVDQDAAFTVLNSKSTEMQNEILSLSGIMKTLQMNISRHISTISTIIQETTGQVEFASSLAYEITTLDELSDWMRRFVTTSTKELQVATFHAISEKALSPLTILQELKRRIDLGYFAQNGQVDILKSEQAFLKDRYVHDCHILHMRLEEQSRVLKQTTDEYSLLKMSYENDMEEVRSLTCVLKQSITTLELQLASTQERLQHLLRSELLEELNLAVTGSKFSKKSDLVSAFWNEKPETRVQLLEWFSDSHPNLIRNQNAVHNLTTPSSASRIHR